MSLNFDNLVELERVGSSGGKRRSGARSHASRVWVTWLAALFVAAASDAHAQTAVEPPPAAPSQPVNPELPASPGPTAPDAPPSAAASAPADPASPPPAATPATAEPVVQAAPTAAPPGPVAPPAVAAPSFPDWTRHIKLGGGAILYYYQPLKKDWDNDLSFFYGRLDLDIQVGAFGFHIEPRFRDGKLRPFYEGPAWIEEGYGSWEIAPFATLKLGKLYSRLGLFWDNSFYGNVQVYDGLKLAPDYGASIEGTFGDRIGLNYWAQFFVADGRTNVSLANRDTVSVPGARRRNEVVLNVEPFVRFGDDGLLRAGVSLQHLDADLPGDENSVLRLAAHAKLTVAAFGAWGELLHQNGRHVTDFPFAGTPATDDDDAVPGRASGDNTYFEVGAEYTIASFTLRYNVSRASYSDVKVHEWLHVPAISYKVAEPLTLLAEIVIWRRHTPDGDSDVDKSLNVTLNASF
jgi:hypothetical protein